MEPDELIEKLGGSSAIAVELGVAGNTVGNWRKRGIPSWAMPALAKLCEQHGIDHRGMLEPSPPRRSKAVA